MATKADQHQVKLTGPGLSFDRPISEEIAKQIINLIMTGVTPPTGSGLNTRVAAPGGEITARQFLADKRPSNDYERVACLAYYLTHHGNSPQFKTRDISKVGTDAAVRVSNPSQAVQNATNAYHYLVPAGRGRKQITTLGEAVVNALPNRDAVKAAMAEHKPKRRRRRGSKRK
jgi:hypothetical protein